MSPVVSGARRLFVIRVSVCSKARVGMTWQGARDLEGREGIEPSHGGFADRRVTTSPPSHVIGPDHCRVQSKSPETTWVLRALG